ncbi:MAG: EamA family transporter [Proteobacteria bacterium]|nr:EamA family transporter [Pseudomonadota bacterium]
MIARESKEYLDLNAIITLIILTLVWGFNQTAIKYSHQGISPVFTSALRSIIASICGIAYCLTKGQRIFHTDIRLFHGLVVGLLFGLEFACIYFGLFFTHAARSVVFIYLSPFVVAVGAHFFLKGDRLTTLKMLGLILAFSGIFLVFLGKPKVAKPTMFLGDVLEIMAAFLWGATTLYIKRFMAERVHPINTFLYQLFFSIPILLVISFILEPQWVYGIDPYIVASIFYQSIIVAFMSYFVWFKLIHTYSVSRLSAFTFFTPIFGVIFGTILLGEEFTVSLMVGLPMVSLGIFFVNWRTGR